MTSFGAMIVRTVPPAALIDHAVAIQSFYDELWVVEDLPFAGGISQAAAVLAATDDVIVGHGIAPAPFRNPAALAMEWATLAELFPGRFYGGVGHGVQTWMADIGERVGSPMTLLAETIVSVRTILAGDTATVRGRYVRQDDIALVFPPAVPPPVFAGVHGPKSLRLAGAIADGTILPEGHGPTEVQAARALIDAGRADQSVRGGPVLADHHHLTVFAGFHVGSPDGRAEPNPDAPVGWEAASESVDEVVATLATLIDAGVDSVVLTPLGQDPEAQLVLAGEEIVPRLRRRADRPRNEAVPLADPGAQPGSFADEGGESQRAWPLSAHPFWPGQSEG